MAHDIHNDSAMMYVGELPWHGLGTQLPANATWEEVKATVGFYDVVERPLYAAGLPVALKDHKALVRPDTGDVLSVVGKGYGVVQFSEMAQTVIDAAGGSGAIFHTAGLLGKYGARGWLLGELPNPISVFGDPSPMRKYFLAYAGHDGFTPISLANVTTRVVCANTVAAALSEREGARWTIRHTRTASERMQAAGHAFRNLVTNMERFGDLANLMAKIRFSDSQFRETLDKVFPVKVDAEGKESTRTVNKRDTLLDLARGSRETMRGVQGTAWGAFQAWTEYADHHQQLRLTDGREKADARLDSVWFGTAADLKRDALHVIADIGGFKIPARLSL